MILLTEGKKSRETFLESLASGTAWGITVAQLRAVGRIHDIFPYLGGRGAHIP
jgi:hypothetical protein